MKSVVEKLVYPIITGTVTAIIVSTFSAHYLSNYSLAKYVLSSIAVAIATYISFKFSDYSGRIRENSHDVNNIDGLRHACWDRLNGVLKDPKNHTIESLISEMTEVKAILGTMGNLVGNIKRRGNGIA